MNTKNRKYIVRFSTVSSKSWQFRHASSEAGWLHPFSKNFTDKAYGSKLKALNAAIKFRDSYLLRIGKLKTTLVYTNPKRYRNSNNKSGVLGVHLAAIERNNNIYFSWNAYTMINNKRKVKSFSVLKYGEKKAFINACEFRYKICGRLSVFCNIKDLPDSPGVPYKKINNRGFKND